MFLNQIIYFIFKQGPIVIDVSGIKAFYKEEKIIAERAIDKVVISLIVQTYFLVFMRFLRGFVC